MSSRSRITSPYLLVLPTVTILAACSGGLVADSVRPARGKADCPDGSPYCVHLPIVSNGPQTTISIDPGQVISPVVSPLIWGLAPGTGWLNDESNPIDTSTTRALGGRLLRYPMGCKVDGYEWQTGRIRASYEGTDYDVLGYTPAQVMDAAAAAEVEVMWVANINPKPGYVDPCGLVTIASGNGPFPEGADGVAQNTVALLDHLAARGTPLTYLELGNEPWGPRDQSPDGNPDDGRWHPTEYAEVVVAVAAAVKATHPTVKLGLVGQPTTVNNMDPSAVQSRQQWTSMIESIIGRQCTSPGGPVRCFDFLTDHPYINDGYHDWVGFTVNTTTSELTAAHGVYFYPGSAVRLRSTEVLPSLAGQLIRADETLYISLPQGTWRSSVFRLHRDKAAAEAGQYLTVTAAGSGIHSLIVHSATNFKGRAAFIPLENFHGAHLSGIYPDTGILEMAKHESGGLPIALTEWNIINWKPAYNNPVNTVEHGLFTLEALLEMARHGAVFGTFWDCFPYSTAANPATWKAQCQAFELSSAIAGSEMVGVDVQTSQRSIPYVGFDSLGTLRGGYESPFITAYAAKTSTRLEIFVLNKHPEQAFSVRVSVAAQGVYQTSEIKALTADFTDRSFSVAETGPQTFGNSTSLTLPPASTVRMTLR